MNPLGIATPAEEVEEEFEELAQLPVVKRAERSVRLATEYVPQAWIPARAGAEAHKAIPRRGIPC